MILYNGQILTNKERLAEIVALKKALKKLLKPNEFVYVEGRRSTRGLVYAAAAKRARARAIAQSYDTK